MQVTGFEVAAKFSRKHRDATAWLNNWRDTATAAEWSSLKDVRETFPHADGVKVDSGLIVTVFNVKGNEYRLLTRINYKAAVVLVLDVLTHEEYDERRWVKKL